jgi:hypothetical protein
LAGVLFCAPIYSAVVKTPPRSAASSITANIPAQDKITNVVKRNASNEPQAFDEEKPSAEPKALDEQGGTADSSPSTLNQTNLGTEQFPAPSAKVWAAVAEMLQKGFRGLPPGVPWAMVIGGLIGVCITLAEEFLPHRYVRWLPSATGLGVAGVVPASNSISMFLGALAAWIWTKYDAPSADKYVISSSAGLIAGESLMAVAIILWSQGWELLSRAF